MHTQQIPEETYYSELETIISKYRDQMIGPGETAVHELPVSEAQQQLEKSK